MLRHLAPVNTWRSLDKAFWAADLPFGRKTVIYGHNGSGKSTLSELLLSVAEGSCATDITWEDEEGQKTRIRRGEGTRSLAMAVFTRKWVETNLSDFLDGEDAGASAIVTLGQTAIAAKTEEERLVQQISDLVGKIAAAKSSHEGVQTQIKKLAQDVQDAIVKELAPFDYNYYSKHRFTLPKIHDLLRQHNGGFPHNTRYVQALRELREGAPGALLDLAKLPAGIADALSGLSQILLDTPSRTAIQDLEENPAGQNWVEDGVELHRELDNCLFCAGTISDQRRAELARHFDESWLEIRRRAQELLRKVAEQKAALRDWLQHLPSSTDFASGLQDAYDGALLASKSEIERHCVVLAALETVLESKVNDPSATPEPPDWSVLGISPTVEGLVQLIREQNELAKRHEEAAAQNKQTVLAHLVGAKSAAFRELETKAHGYADSLKRDEEALSIAKKELLENREEQFTTGTMAETLTRDLARVYGKNHLRIAVTPDGRSYACLRGNEPARNLSSGERTTLALLYFLRKLRDERVPGDDPLHRIVVIDDPSSSLDREAIFATHQWLVDTLEGFGQYIILTHDFSLLRLFIKSHKNASNNSTAKIRKGDADEIRFPRVSFLEMYAASFDGERHSRIGVLPPLLLKNTSEYAYLFSMVMAGIADSDDHERLFLLPNAARRVLEVFASYKVPDRTDFSKQLEMLVANNQGEPFRDVYDFCNRRSHGEGSESVDVLDARAVQRQIHRCMEFLHAVDEDHFKRMCKATDYDPNLIS